LVAKCQIMQLLVNNSDYCTVERNIRSLIYYKYIVTIMYSGVKLNVEYILCNSYVDKQLLFMRTTVLHMYVCIYQSYQSFPICSDKDKILPRHCGWPELSSVYPEFAPYLYKSLLLQKFIWKNYDHSAHFKYQIHVFLVKK